MLFLFAQIPVRMIIILGLSPKLSGFEREESAFRETLVYHYHRKKQKQMEHTTEEQSISTLRLEEGAKEAPLDTTPAYVSPR